MFSIQIDGTEIGNILKITDVNRGGLAPVENNTRTYSGVNGSRLLNKRYNQRPITIDFVCYGEIDEKWELVKKILTRNETLKIVFGDYPDRYFLVTTDGDTSFNKMTGTYATGTISLVAYYPFAIANKELEAVQDNNKLTFTNDGTANGYPSFKFTADRNYKMFGFRHANGEIAQFGYSSNVAPVIQAGQVCIYDTRTNKAKIDGKLVYLSEGRGFTVAPGQTEIALVFPESATQIVKGTVRSEYH